MSKSLLAVLLVASTVFAENDTVRNTRWGMTVEEVKAVETWEYLGRENNIIGFQGELKKGVSTNLYYTFHNDRLMRLRYSMKGDGFLFQFFYKALKEKYGRPHLFETENGNINEKWLNTYGVYGDRSQFLSAKWKIHDGQTNVQLLGGYNKTVEIYYSHKDYKKLQEQIKKDQERDEMYNVQNDL